MLCRRREKFEIFRIQWEQNMWQYHNGEPAEDDQRVLRELIEAGIKIDLGPGLNARMKGGTSSRISSPSTDSHERLSEGD